MQHIRMETAESIVYYENKCAHTNWLGLLLVTSMAVASLVLL